MDIVFVFIFFVGGITIWASVFFIFLYFILSMAFDKRAKPVFPHAMSQWRLLSRTDSAENKALINDLKIMDEKRAKLFGGRRGKIFLWIMSIALVMTVVGGIGTLATGALAH